MSPRFEIYAVVLYAKFRTDNFTTTLMEAGSDWRPILNYGIKFVSKIGPSFAHLCKLYVMPVGIQIIQFDTAELLVKNMILILDMFSRIYLTKSAYSYATWHIVLFPMPFLNAIPFPGESDAFTSTCMFPIEFAMFFLWKGGGVVVVAATCELWGVFHSSQIKLAI